MKKVLLAFALLLILTFGMVFAQNKLKTKPTAAINNRIFELDIADSQKEREVGLSETESLSENQGMIFIFDKPGYYSFWMKNMKFPIDIIYINKDTIVTIKNNVKPPKDNKESPIIYAPTALADRVLEIQAGLSEKYNFKNGDKVQYENLSN
ncbi:MAG: DUF192 domain-containing protein [Candidatus Levybacteria bacterium]|nr:DUF192 domain-containing protein [Candidatus Levybacteria bacterium]